MSLIIDNRWQNFHLSIYFREIFPKEIHIRRCNASDLPISAMAFKTVMSTVIVAYVKKVRKKESMMFVTDFSRNTISQDVVQLNDKRLVLLVLKNCALVSSSFSLSGRRQLFSRIPSEGNKLAWRLTHQQRTSLLVGTCDLLEQLGSHPSWSKRASKYYTSSSLSYLRGTCTSNFFLFKLGLLTFRHFFNTCLCGPVLRMA